jgi:hypothetical protein
MSDELALARAGHQPPMTAIVGFTIGCRIQVKAIKANTIHPFAGNLCAADLTDWAVVTTRLREVGALGGCHRELQRDSQELPREHFIVPAISSPSCGCAFRHSKFH